MPPGGNKGLGGGAGPQAAHGEAEAGRRGAGGGVGGPGRGAKPGGGWLVGGEGRGAAKGEPSTERGGRETGRP